MTNELMNRCYMLNFEEENMVKFLDSTEKLYNLLIKEDNDNLSMCEAIDYHSKDTSEILGHLSSREIFLYELGRISAIVGTICNRPNLKVKYSEPTKAKILKFNRDKSESELD